MEKKLKDYGIKIKSGKTSKYLEYDGENLTGKLYSDIIDSVAYNGIVIAYDKAGNKQKIDIFSYLPDLEESKMAKKQMIENKIRKIVRQYLKENDSLTDDYELLSKKFDRLLSDSMRIFERLELDETREGQILFRKFEDEIIGPLGGMIDSIDYFIDYTKRYDKIKNLKSTPKKF